LEASLHKLIFSSLISISLPVLSRRLNQWIDHAPVDAPVKGEGMIAVRANSIAEARKIADADSMHRERRSIVYRATLAAE
jgi:hypothetical protein